MAIIVTMRVADMPNPVDGVIVRMCAECRERVWVSPSSLRIQHDEEQTGETVNVVCIQCAEDVLPEHPTWKPIRPDQIRELRRYLDEETG